MVTSSNFAMQGVKYIGKSYSEMDCQALVERMLGDVGIHKDWKGSNAMYRDMAWVGDVDECIARYGSVPVGALLFIHAFDGGEEERGYHDGLGNASHVGVKTGTGLGAIHSSASRGCVAESKFSDKAIPGGWNKVGLLKMLDYGLNDPEKEEEVMNANATIIAENGKPVNFRREPRKGSATYGQLPVGTEVEIIESLGAWTTVRYGGNVGYIMSEFLTPIIPSDGECDEGLMQSLLSRLAAAEELLAEHEELLAGHEARLSALEPHEPDDSGNDPLPMT